MPSLRVLSLLMFILCAYFGSGQLNAGFSYGIQYPGQQDLKYKKYNSDGQHLQTIKSSKVYSSNSAIPSFFVNQWKNRWGIGFEYMVWEHHSIGTEFISKDRVDQPATEQSREAFLLNLMYRTNISRRKNKSEFVPRKFTYFVGLGFGLIATDIDFGLENNLRSGFQANAGVNIKISESIHFVIQSKYILTHDADNISGPANRAVIDTSGSWTPFRFNAHFDTRYYATQIGITWRIFQ